MKQIIAQRLALPLVSALALSIAAPAHAGLSEDFSECDGLRKPKNSDDGMRGEASFPAYRYRGEGDPGRTIAACDRAFASGKLRPEQALRRAHMLRARAAAKLQMDDAAGAIADLDAAQQAGQSYAGEFFYDRSMGVSLDLLRALALNASGQRDAALALADAAAARRPYALEIQRVATLLRAAGGDDTANQALWASLGRIDPQARDIQGPLVAKPADLVTLAASAGAPTVTLESAQAIALQAITAPGRLSARNITNMVSDWSAPVRDAMLTSYALAANGRPDAARAWIEASRTALDAIDPPAGATASQPATSASEGGANPPSNSTFNHLFADYAREQYLKPYTLLIEARIAIAEGRLADAAKALEGQQFRSAPATEEFYAAYAAARTAAGGTAPELPALTPAEVRAAPALARLADNLLFRPESRRNLIDYQRSRPNILGALVGAAFSMGTSLIGGVERTSGFSSTPNADGTIKVEYTGNIISSPVVQEMTLLRAAEVAKEAGKSHFHIVSRNDYQRSLVTTQYNVETSRTLTGYKTELTIRLLDDGASEANALDAVAVIDALGPTYYENGTSRSTSN